eukprot:GILJ01011792.1.p1 GENE.GILJ01011792.1~~GILJ01011792.1.p1  ORF type:complete len:678 (-),score=85.38 GILJ01011792.1:108-2141(-)
MLLSVRQTLPHLRVLHIASISRRFCHPSLLSLQDSFDVESFISKHHNPYTGNGTFLTTTPISRTVSSTQQPVIAESSLLLDGDVVTGMHSNQVDSRDMYTDTMRAAIHSRLLVGLPPPGSIGRPGLVADYRRVALFGVDALIFDKKEQLKELEGDATDGVLQLRAELLMQIKALERFKSFAANFGSDVARPAHSAQEALEWIALACTFATSETTAGCIPLGRLDSFIDIYISKDLRDGVIDELGAQVLVDSFCEHVGRLRSGRQTTQKAQCGKGLLFPISLGGLNAENQPLVTQTTYRFLNGRPKVDHAPELVVLWSSLLDSEFKQFCTKMVLENQQVSLSFANDDLIRSRFGSDYAVGDAGMTVSTGRQVGLHAGSFNLPKLLLYVLNEGKDEVSGKQVCPKFGLPSKHQVDYVQLRISLDRALEWVCDLHQNAVSMHQFIQDRHHYEGLQMALHDTNIRGAVAFGVAGLPVFVNSLAAIKSGQVCIQTDNQGMVSGFQQRKDLVENSRSHISHAEFEAIASEVIGDIQDKLTRKRLYRDCAPILAMADSSADLFCAHKTGATPDGRRAGQPFTKGYDLFKLGVGTATTSLSMLSSSFLGGGLSESLHIHADGHAKDVCASVDTFFKRGGHRLAIVPEVIDRAAQPSDDSTAGFSIENLPFYDVEHPNDTTRTVSV